MFGFVFFIGLKTTSSLNLTTKNKNADDLKPENKFSIGHSGFYDVDTSKYSYMILQPRTMFFLHTHTATVVINGVILGPYQYHGYYVPENELPVVAYFGNSVSFGATIIQMGSLAPYCDQFDLTEGYINEKFYFEPITANGSTLCIISFSHEEGDYSMEYKHYGYEYVYGDIEAHFYDINNSRTQEELNSNKGDHVEKKNVRLFIAVADPRGNYPGFSKDDYIALRNTHTSLFNSKLELKNNYIISDESPSGNYIPVFPEPDPEYRGLPIEFVIFVIVIPICCIIIVIVVIILIVCYCKKIGCFACLKKDDNQLEDISDSEPSRPQSRTQQHTPASSNNVGPRQSVNVNANASVPSSSPYMPQQVYGSSPSIWPVPPCEENPYADL